MVPSLSVFERYLDNELNNILNILVSPELIQAVEPVKEDMGLLEAMDMVRGLEYLSYDNRLRDFGEEKALGKPNSTFQHLKGCCKKVGETFKKDMQ